MENLPLPHVSVLMPVRNEESFILRSLGAVLSQDYPPELVEVIVADGMSTDSTRSLLESVGAKHPNVRLVDNPGLIAPTGLNAATREAKGDIIIRVDGHCEIARDYVANCVRHLMCDGVDGVGGSWRTVGETRVAQSIAIAVASRFGVGNNPFRITFDQDLLVDTIPFPAYLRRTVERAGPYDEELVRDQDDEYNYRIRDAGGKLLQAADVYSVYYSRSSLKSLAIQYFQYGFWKVRVAQKHPRRMKPRHFIPALFVGSLIVSGFLAPFFRVARRLLILVSGLYLMANIAVSVSLSLKKGGRHLLLLPPAFVTMHVSYGAGFLAGLVRLSGKWRAKQR